MAITITHTNGITEDLSAGCYGDSHRGTYLGELVQDLAAAYGWEGPTVPSDPDDCDDCAIADDAPNSHGLGHHGADYHYESYDDATNEAEEFLNAHTTGGYWTFDEGFYLIDRESVCERCDYGADDTETLAIIDGDRYCERCAALINGLEVSA